jgi:hypothetical protein
MKHILIPTDFSIRSLRVVHHAVDRFGANGPLNIVMFHAMQMPGSIMDLMMLARRSSQYDLITEDYKEASEIVKNKYGSALQSFKTEFLMGRGNGVFRNFLLYHNIDAILCPSEPNFRKASPNSYDPAELIRKSDLPVYHVSLKKKERMLVSAMSELFEI